MKNQEKSKYLLLGTLIGIGLYKGIHVVKNKISEINIIKNAEPIESLDEENNAMDQQYL